MESRVLYTPKAKKHVPLRAQRSIKRHAVLGGIGLMLAAVSVLLYGPWLRVEHISIFGAGVDDELLIQRAIKEELAGARAWPIPKRNILFFSASMAVQTLQKKFPIIETADIEKKIPNAVHITIKKRSLLGIICLTSTPVDEFQEAVVSERGPEPCGYIDAHGIVYDEAPSSSGYLISKITMEGHALVIGEQAVDRKTIEQMAKISEELPRVLGGPIVGYRILKRVPSEIRVQTGQGFTLILKKDDDFLHIWGVLKTVLEKEIGSKKSQLDYIDLRFGNKVFYKFKE